MFFLITIQFEAKQISMRFKTHVHKWELGAKNSALAFQPRSFTLIQGLTWSLGLGCIRQVFHPGASSRPSSANRRCHRGETNRSRIFPISRRWLNTGFPVWGDFLLAVLPWKKHCFLGFGTANFRTPCEVWLSLHNQVSSVPLDHAGWVGEGEDGWFSDPSKFNLER